MTGDLWRSLQEEYQRIFGERWPPWIGGLLVGFTSVLLFAYARPWSTSDGLRNWGEWLWRLLSLPTKDALSPLLYSSSVVNGGFLLGAFAAALLAREFAIRIPPLRELGKGLVGGVLMGIGAVLSMGCNVGGFFSALSALSLSGVGMMVGLMIGAYVGLQYLLWEERRGPSGSSGWLVGAEQKGFQPYLGFVVLISIFAIALLYDARGYAERGALVLFGMILGMVSQRSRFCFVSCFREPWRSGDSRMTRAVILALMVSVMGFAVLKWTGLKAVDAFVFPSFWQGSLVGGIIFGIGMVLAGGCGTSALWRAGEGNMKHWIALLGFALAGSLLRGFLEERDLMMKLGKAIFPIAVPEGIGTVSVEVLLLYQKTPTSELLPMAATTQALAVK